MQSNLVETGIEKVEFRCNVCPYGCVLSRYQAAGAPKRPVHNHPCHWSPSLTTAWERIA